MDPPPSSPHPLSSPSHSSSPYPEPRPHATLFRLGLQPLIVHFHSLGNGYMDPRTLDQFDTKILKRILSDTAKKVAVREQLGRDRAVWTDLRELFFAGSQCLGSMCCTSAPVAHGISQGGAEEGDDGGAERLEDVASSILIVKNYGVLVKDVARIITLVAIARNILTIGPSAQDLAADVKVEEAIFALLTLCVRVTGRGFDSGGTKDEERKWQAVVNDFKRLLASCLQFLNNLIAQNERRKLLLWIQLFDSPPESDGTGPAVDRRLIEGLRDDPIVNGYSLGIPSNGIGKDGVPHVIRRFKDGLLAHMNRLEDRRVASGRPTPIQPVLDKEHLSSSPFLLYIGKVGMDIKKELQDAGKPAGATEIAAECKRRWQAMSKEEQKSWHDYYAKLLDSYREEAEPDTGSSTGGRSTEEAGKNQALRDSVVSLAQSVEQIQSDIRNLSIAASQRAQGRDLSQEHIVEETNSASLMIGDSVQLSLPHSSSPDAAPATESDYSVTYSAHYGATILQQGKEDLLRRLEPDHIRLSRSQRARTRSPPPTLSSQADVDGNHGSDSQNVPEPPDAPLTLASDDERDGLSEDEDSEYDDPVPGDDGRGLLTDVPLILGPTEIEVLPMIIQSGIVPPGPSQPGYGSTPEENAALRSMHTLRCHLLLAQDNGRNLLRELLIFVAAWDLREEELYFQLMTQIIEAVLINGLLPFSYHAFRESKDVISPAQAVIMKLLTHIFRRRQAETAKKGLAIFPRNTSSPEQKDGENASPSPASESAAEKREQSYPHRVDVHMVSFLLTEFRRHIIPQTCALIFLQGQIRAGLVSPEEFPLNLWDMERMYEGIYQYLEFFAILTEHERWKEMMADWEITSELITLLEELEAAIPRATARNMESRRGRANMEQAPLAATDGQPRVAVERPYDPHSEIQPQEFPTSEQHIQGTNGPPPPPPPPLEDEPSDFEWRNLKKLAVLVLSSLVWKSRKVQEQLGAAGPLAGSSSVSSQSHRLKGRGIRALLNCCKVDDYNPYIREHAIMALRFALEGNEENQDIVRGLERMADDEGSSTLSSGGTATLSQRPRKQDISPPGQSGPSGSSTSTSSIPGNAPDRTTITTASGMKVEVPKEVLDLNGYETFVDSRGQVQLKKRDHSQRRGKATASANAEFGEDDFM
ncbi:uncharacterized protein PV09_04628 [Verruconis gallopava]|uniref:Ataxin-10 homolog n=1 Tax=Verruconis gallopava TaxID=253628 RepID=A0A0D2ABW4_9PEZI|nr:uncharacterized protein PV09_04628 [Verruconis gallopava]KIW04338.1 hypothetical protein PV09_04628 [Verruconis gallopava]